MRGVTGAGLLLAGLLLAFFSLASAPASAEAARPPATAGTPGSFAPSADAERGRLLLQAKGCVGCHSVSHAGLRPVIGGDSAPDLSALREVAASRRPGLAADRYVRESILAPAAFIVPGYAGALAMPDLGLSGDEVDAILTLLLGPR